jgi:hypothetical protein
MAELYPSIRLAIGPCFASGRRASVQREAPSPCCLVLGFLWSHWQESRTGPLNLSEFSTSKSQRVLADGEVQVPGPLWAKPLAIHCPLRMAPSNLNIVPLVP